MTTAFRLSSSSSVGTGAIFATSGAPGRVVSKAKRSPARIPSPVQVDEWSAVSRTVQVPDGWAARVSRTTWPMATPSSAPASM